MSRSARSQLWGRPSVAAGLYLIAALALHWPLPTVLTSRLAGDDGDTFFNGWVLLWTSGQVLRALGGDLSALGDYWNGNIFYPTKLTLAFSEHLTPQMLQALPVLAVSGNIVLAYNLLFLATIVLSGLGMYLLVRELTGEPFAAFAAGLAFAFAPYRIDQYAHIEVISSQWMPFALYGFRRFFVTSRLGPLVGAAAALLTQGLSCGYYLAYFTPFAVAYCLYEMIARGRLRDVRTWAALVIAGTAVLVVIAVVLAPYAQVRRAGEVGVRDITEIQHFSADTHAFATASDKSRLWGRTVRALPHVEGQGFPGFAIFALAAIGVGAGVGRSVRARVERERTSPAHPVGRPRWRRGLARFLGAALMLFVILLIEILITGGGVRSIGGIVVHYGYPRLVTQILVASIALAIVSPWFRQIVRGVPGSTVAFFGWSALAAAWLSLGPEMYAAGRYIGPGLYDVFYRWVPGFNGLRVPSLNLMLVAFFLAVLAGFGAARLVASSSAGRFAAVLAMIAIVAECWSVSPLTAAPNTESVYRSVRDLPAGAVIAEFPFGGTFDEIRYTFVAGHHRRPMINGYSGFFPVGYQALVAHLSRATTDPEAWSALAASGATHAIVHEGPPVHAEAVEISGWLRRNGAREIAAESGDRLFALR